MTAQRGFTLVEMMISLVLFSLAVTGVLSVAVSFSNGLREQRAAVGAEAAARLTLVSLTDALRQVSPGVPSGAIQDAGTCATGALTVTNSATGPDALDIIHGMGGFITSTQTVYGAGTTSLRVTDASQLAAGDHIVISNWSQGHLVKISRVDGTQLTLAAPCGAINLPAGGYPVGSLVIRAQHSTFSISSVGDVPTMMMDGDSTGSATAEPFAEGIEDLQVAIGVDTGGDGALTEVGTAAGDDEWQGNVAGDAVLAGEARAVRVTVVSRATRPLSGPARPFSQPAAEDRPAGTSFDAYRRRALRSTVEIRNLTGSP